MNQKTDLTIYIPLFNEEDGVEYLKNELEISYPDLSNLADIDIVLINDGSTDKTPYLLEKYFQDKNIGLFIMNITKI